MTKGRPQIYYPPMPIEAEEAWHRKVMERDYPLKQLEKANLTELRRLFKEKSHKIETIPFKGEDDGPDSNRLLSSNTGKNNGDSNKRNAKDPPKIEYFDLNTIKIRKPRKTK